MIKLVKNNEKKIFEKNDLRFSTFARQGPVHQKYWLINFISAFYQNFLSELRASKVSVISGIKVISNQCAAALFINEKFIEKNSVLK